MKDNDSDDLAHSDDDSPGIAAKKARLRAAMADSTKKKTKPDTARIRRDRDQNDQVMHDAASSLAYAQERGSKNSGYLNKLKSTISQNLKEMRAREDSLDSARDVSKLDPQPTDKRSILNRFKARFDSMQKVTPANDESYGQLLNKVQSSKAAEAAAAAKPKPIDTTRIKRSFEGLRDRLTRTTNRALELRDENRGHEALAMFEKGDKDIDTMSERDDSLSTARGHLSLRQPDPDENLRASLRKARSKGDTTTLRRFGEAVKRQRP